MNSKVQLLSRAFFLCAPFLAACGTDPTASDLEVTTEEQRLSEEQSLSERRVARPGFEPPILGYIDELPYESATQAASRHEKVAQRRATNQMVMVHRGAFAFAPENMLEAYAAAMDYGADGVEIDIRETADGVLMMFHDDYLERLVDGFGDIDQLTYYELLELEPRLSYGTANSTSHFPTLVATLEWARQRAALLHLDIKRVSADPSDPYRPTIAERVAELLEEADMWDHVIEINTSNSGTLREDPRVELLSPKAPGLYNFGRDVDPAATAEDLSLPGEWILVDDPRTAALVLGRPGFEPVPLGWELRRLWWPSHRTPSQDPLVVLPMGVVDELKSEIDENDVSSLLRALSESPLEERTEPFGTPEYEAMRKRHIIERSYIARRLGQLGRKRPAVIDALSQLLNQRSIDCDWRFHGLDGAMAAEALGELGARRGVNPLIDWFEDPRTEELAALGDCLFAGIPAAWQDWRTRQKILTALGEIPGDIAGNWLMEAVSLDLSALMPAANDRLSISTMKHATRSERRVLLEFDEGVIRANAILFSVDGRPLGYRRDLGLTQPWSLELPAAPDRSRYVD